MRYFTVAGEDIRLDDATRSAVRGDFVGCTAGITHYEVAGPDSGELVLLVGGLTIPLYNWDRFASEIHRRGYRTLAYSAYGRGYSERVHASYDRKLFVDQVDDLCRALGVRPQHVVGTSMGALIAMDYIRECNRDITTTSLIGPAGLSDGLPRGAALPRHGTVGVMLAKCFGRRMLDAHLGHNVRNPQLAQELATMVRTCYRVEGSVYALCSTIADYPLTNRADTYAEHQATGVPTMVVWGSDDAVTPIDKLDEVRSLVKPSAVHVIDDCGHMAPFEAPDRVADRFHTFVTTST
ncbi:alpha/beta fold hydrolase [Gordonia sp. NPDC003424]